MTQLQKGVRIALALLLLLSMLLSVSCKQNKIIPSEDAIGDIGAFLDLHDVEYAITEKDAFSKWIGHFRIEKTPFDKYAEVYTSESETEWKYVGYADAFDFMNSASYADGVLLSEDASLTLYKEIDGITIPCGVTFEDSFDETAMRLGFGEKLRTRFTADEGSQTVMTLAEKDGKTIVYRNLVRGDKNTEEKAPLLIEYAERGEYARKDGSKGTWHRTLTFAFRYENGFPLDHVELAVMRNT